MIDDDDRLVMKKIFKPMGGHTPGLGLSASKTVCPRCFLKDMAAAGKCFCNYRPKFEERSPRIKKILKKLPEQRSVTDMHLLDLEDKRLQEIIDTLEEYISWRKK